jgi:hypothetical protein
MAQPATTASTLAFDAVSAFGTGLVFGAVDFDRGIIPRIVFDATSDAGFETAQDVVLPAGAVVTQAVVRLSAEAPVNPTPVGGIATVRAAAGAPALASRDLVIDFGVLRTVSAVDAPAAISGIGLWRGTSFNEFVPQDFGGRVAEFTEVQAERLLVNLADPVAPATLAADGRVTTTTPPADLELLVGGVRAYQRPGPVPAAFTEDVDVTAALQAAVAAGPVGEDGSVAVPVVLRARVPGTLGLELAQPVGFLRTHAVAFPGPTTTRAFDEEGRLAVALPLPGEATGWTVHRVLATVVATDDDPQRVQPPVGPPPTTDAELTLDPDRRLVVRVPPERFAPFEELVGVRVSARPGDAGIELGGALLEDADGVPGDPVPKGTFAPVTLEASGEAAFVTLPLPQPVRAAADAPLWFSLAATRGSAVVELGAGEDATEDATLWRVMPNGVVRPMSSPAGVRTDVLRLRLVGVPPPLAPIDVVTVDLAGGGAVREPVEPAQEAAGLASLALSAPGPRPGLALELTATAATAVTVGPVVVAYSDPATGGP